MQEKRKRGRRLSGAHITVMVVAACATLAPTAVYAAERMLSVISDPYDSSALARVSQDGRLGVRGETTAQQGLPSNEWHTYIATRPDDFVLLKSAPPGSGIGVSQVTGSWHRRGIHMFLRVAWTASEDACPETVPVFGASLTSLYGLGEALGADRPGIGSKQAVFPVPLTIAPSADKNLCLYAAGFVWTNEGRKDMFVMANGVVGAPTPGFAPPKGGPATTPGGEDEGKDDGEDQP